jgi:hypothetical protein
VLARALRPGTHLDVFAAAMVAGHPEPARRWLTHAIEPGVLLFDAAELRMHGEIRLGQRWLRFTATQALVPDSGFVWAARTRIAHLPVSGYDAYADGAGSMRWRLLGMPLMSAGGTDVTRSAAGRLAIESVLLPTSLVDRTWRAGTDPDTATYQHSTAGRPAGPTVTILVGPNGDLRGATMHRWGDPDGTGYSQHVFEVRFGGEYTACGITLPSHIRARWVDANGSCREFFTAAVDSVEFFTRAAP